MLYRKDRWKQPADLPVEVRAGLSLIPAELLPLANLYLTQFNTGQIRSVLNGLASIIQAFQKGITVIINSYRHVINIPLKQEFIVKSLTVSGIPCKDGH